MEKGRRTEVWSINPNQIDQKQLQKPAELLNKGKVIAFPTETVYGLGADATNEEAVANIFRAKERPADNPLIVHIGDRAQVGQWIKNVPESASKLMDAFWPGPLTIILPIENHFAKNVTAGLQTVGLRMPDHPVALALLKEAAIPVAAPSANRSGKPSPTTASHVLHDLDGRIDGIVDGGQTGVGIESTVIDCSAENPIILRPGGITREEIEAVIGPLSESQTSDEEPPRSPGMKYKHYAPETKIWLVRDTSEIENLGKNLKAEGKSIGYLISNELEQELQTNTTLTLGSRENLGEITKNLYQKLREIDTLNYDIVLAEAFSKEGIGEALSNRLERAASKII